MASKKIKNEKINKKSIENDKNPKVDDDASEMSKSDQSNSGEEVESLNEQLSIGEGGGEGEGIKFQSGAVGEVRKTKFGAIRQAAITDEMKKFYLDYAMSVIVARALPDARDGLKPVHRRIMYAMHGMGLSKSSKHVKSAKVIGEVLGKFHPHGDAAVYEAMVRMAQDFSLRYPLVDGQGNFGSVDGDPPAAMRYTECRLSKIAGELLADIDKQTVDWSENFDNTMKEPVVLPAKIPNLLLMGADGIAVGMATKIPPHNLKEVAGAVIETIKKGKVSRITADDTEATEGDETTENTGMENLLDKKEPKEVGDFTPPMPEPVLFDSEITVDELMEKVQGPDFPTGAYIFDKQSIKEVYVSGRGRIPMRAKCEIEETKGGKMQIVVYEIPYQVNKADLVVKIADLVKEKKVVGIGDLRDESDRAGIRVVMDLKKDAKPKSVLNSLYKHTALQMNYPANLVALVDGTPQTMNLKQMLVEFVRHRHQVVIRRTVFELSGALYRAHILEGLKIALDNLDEVIETIKKSPDAEAAKINLKTKFKLTELQAIAILDMQLRRLAALERRKIEEEYAEIEKKIEYLRSLLEKPEMVLEVITEETREMIEKHGDDRRTKVFEQGLGEFREEDVIANEECVVQMTTSGYIKRVSRGTFRAQRRGGKGVSGMATKEEDEIAKIFSCNTHDWILFFTDQGRVFKLKVYDLPEGLRQAKGQAIINLLNIEQEESVQSVLTVAKEVEKGFILLATKKGLVKKTPLSEFGNIRSSGIIAIKLKEGDSLAWAEITQGDDRVVMVSHEGKAIKFGEKNIRPMGRATSGVTGMKLKDGDYVVTMEVIPGELDKPEDKRRKWFRQILIVMEKGLGKRTDVAYFPLQKRAGQGVMAAKVTEKTGKVAAAAMVNQDVEQVILSTKNAQTIKLPLKNIPELGRATQGVILMRPKAGDKVTAMAGLEKKGEEGETININESEEAEKQF